MILLLLFLSSPVLFAAGDPDEVIAHPDDEILLFCPVNTPECGAFHSLKWYREDTRVYVYSPFSGFSNPEGILMDRCLDLSQRSLGPACARGTLQVNDISADLSITPVKLKDEGQYRCEITYLDISHNCPVVHFTDLRTVAAPESVNILNSEGEDIGGQVVGPYTAGSEAVFTCQSPGGKPAPAMSWTFGGEVIEGDTNVEEDVETGSFLVTSQVIVSLGQENTGDSLTCIVEHEILDDAMDNHIQIDVNVPVTAVSLSLEEAGQEGVEMTLTCTATGGRPAPTFSWDMPGDVEFQVEEDSSLLDDGTFNSISKLTFIPSADEDNTEVLCQVINEVMSEALEDTKVMVIEYAPKVTIQEGNATVATGEEVIINCEINANPAELSQIQWLFNGEALDANDERYTWEVSANPSLHVNPVQPSDSGEYSCSAENEVGQGRSPQTFILEVTAPVESVVIEDNLVSNDGEEMTIVCIARGSRPAATIGWVLPEHVAFEVKEEVNLLEDKTFETLSTMHLIASKEMNEVEITCQAQNEVMEDAVEDQALLNILYPPIVNSEEGNKTVNTGDELIIECEIEANPKNLTNLIWFHNDVELEPDDDRYHWEISETASLTINSVKFLDAGEYYCLAENEVGQGQAEDRLNIIVISIVESVIIEDEAGIEDEEMVITCVATGGIPAASISWIMLETALFSVEEEVRTLDDDTFQTVSRLTFTPTYEEHMKKVSCEAVNEVMEEPVEYETELNILYKPRVDIEDANKTEVAEDTVTLSCLVDANPMNLSLVEWYHDGDLLQINYERYEDGNEESPSLTINPVLPEDAGDYYCLVGNQVGQIESPIISLEVIYPPSVEIRKEPEYEVSEEDDANVTLYCDVVSGNPLEIDTVFWFVDGQLIRQVPDPHCEHNENLESEDLFSENFLLEASDYELGSEFESSGIIHIESEGSGVDIGSGMDTESDAVVNYLCDVEHTELILQHVTREFNGNFSCSGKNIAGVGPRSQAVDLNILYPPGQAVITQEDTAYKGNSVSMLCQLEDQGNPSTTAYIWKRGEEPLLETSSTLTLDNLAVESQGNISCVGINEIGAGEDDSLQLDVLAPPTFIKTLPDKATFVSHDPDISLQCQVECVPLCNIQWMKNDEIISLDDHRYTIEEEIIPEEREKNQFQSISSKVSWNLEHLEDNKLDHDDLNFTVICYVENTNEGDSISSSTKVEVEFAPANVEVSADFVSIEENAEFDPIFCSGEGVPEPSVIWKFNDQIVTSENTLDFSEPIERNQGGEYYCHIANKHGEEVLNVTVDVLYKPECTIEYTLEEEEVVLLCQADANPKDVKFLWEKDNTTFEGQTNETIILSEVRLRKINESCGTYFCHVTNTLGKGDPCVLELTEDMLTAGLSHEVLVILIAVAGSVIVLLIIIIITALLYCREKKEEGGKAKKITKDKSKSPLLRDEEVHADSSFYENLPFKGLKSPPKQALVDPHSDMLDYADVDYLDIYAHGPLKYKEASEKNATLRRKKLEERKAVKSALL